MGLKITYEDHTGLTPTITRSNSTQMTSSDGTTYYEVTAGGIWNITYSSAFTCNYFTLNFLEPIKGKTITVMFFNGNALVYQANTISESSVASLVVELASEITITRMYIVFSLESVNIISATPGIDKIFYPNELSECTAYEYCSISKVDFPTSYMNVTIDGYSDYLYGVNKSVKAYFDNTFLGKLYVSKYNQRGNSTDFTFVDILGVMDSISYPYGADIKDSTGNMTPTAIQILMSFFNGGVGVPFTMTYSASTSIKLTKGIVPPGTVKHRIQQFIFVANTGASYQWYLRSMGSNGYEIIDTQTTPTTISADNTFDNVKIENLDDFGGIRLISHQWAKTTDAGGILIQDLAETQRFYYYDENPIEHKQLNANSEANIKSCDGATLVTELNATTTLANIYANLSKKRVWKATIKWNGELVGDYVTVYDRDSNTYTGYIQAMKMAMTNTCIADIEVLLDV